MKKIRLNVADLDATEILSRDQLKAIFGGSGSGSGSGSSTKSCYVRCYDSDADNNDPSYCGSTCPTTYKFGCTTLFASCACA